MRKLKLPSWKSFLIFPEHVVLSLSIIGVTGAIGAILAMTEGSSDKSLLVMSKLNTLQTKITTLQDAVIKPLPEVNFSGITQQVQQLSQQLEDIRAQNSNHFDQSLNKTEAALAIRLDAIQQLVRHLDELKSPIKFLSPKALPFKVVSLDSIQHIPVASIAYDFKTIPLEKDDSLAGWRVVHIDYGKQRVEFESVKKERVVLTHEHIG